MSDIASTSCFGLNSGSKGFYDPFMLSANDRMPTEFKTALDVCPFLYYLNESYRQGNARVVGHFVTNEIDFRGRAGDKREQDNLRDYLQDHLDIFGAMMVMGKEWGCFAPETKVPTRNGVYAIKDLTGKKVEVLSKGGVYRWAEFKSFGVQPLLEVEYTDGRKTHATPEHQWEVLNCSGKEVKIQTTELRRGHRIKRTVSVRPEKDSEYEEGVRHGFIFGDGSMSSKGKRTTALFVGAKAASMIPHFEGHGNKLRPRADHAETSRMSGLSSEFKTLPAAEASASYWYGFISGFLAADGSVDSRDGCVVLTQAKRSTLEAIEAQLPRLGMVAGKLKEQTRDTDLRKYNNSPRAVYKGHKMYMLSLLKGFMQEGDFLLDSHKANFVNSKATSTYGTYIGIKAVRPTKRYEEVFCCVEPETHTFVIENGILTGNCYGNSFFRIHFPFNRSLVDRRNGSYREWSLGIFPEALIKYDWQKLVYIVPDPLEMSRGVAADKAKKVEMSFRDKKSTDLSRISLRKLNPQRLTLKYAEMSGRCGYIYQFETDFVDDVKKGLLWQVNETPISMLKAIKADEDYEFFEDQVFHFKAPTISGVSNRGWGLPETLANFRAIHNLQVFRKIDEAVGLDYMLPFRIFSPGNSAEAYQYLNSVQWKSAMEQVVSNRRKNLFSMHVLPFPVEYAEAGGSGKALSPKDHVDYHTAALLDSMGYPAELYKGTMNVQNIPTTLRIFENSFHFIYRNFDLFLKWVTRRVLDYLGRELLTPTLRRPSMANDIEQRQLLIQLASAGEIPRDLAYRSLGIYDAVEAFGDRINEDIAIEKKKTVATEGFQREQLAGTLGQESAEEASASGGGNNASQGGGGGAMGGAPMNAALTPLDNMERAKQEAMNLLNMPVGERMKRMRQLEATDKAFHAIVKQEMEVKRSEGASAGRAQAGQM